MGWFRRKTILWLRSALAACIGGAANNVLAFLGIGAANLLGIHVQQLTFAQMKVLLGAGAIVGLCAYLAKSPLPPASGDTDFYKKNTRPPPMGEPNDS